jgi:hypothetical protein
MRDVDVEKPGQHVAGLPGTQSAVDEKTEHQGR